MNTQQEDDREGNGHLASPPKDLFPTVLIATLCLAFVVALLIVVGAGSSAWWLGKQLFGV